MKVRHLILIPLVAFSFSFTSCTPRNPEEDPAAQGIRASQTGSMTREDVYNWQDRTFRELAY